jgi:TolB protein
MRRKLVGVGAALLTLAVVAAVFARDAVAPALATFPGANGKIAFVSDRDSGNLDVYDMSSDGSDQVRLTSNPLMDTSPAWSADGSTIAFVGDPDGGNFEVMAMSANGSGQVRVTTDPGADGSPSWAPDGQRIAFHTTRDDPGCTFPCNFDIYVVNADGSEAVRLTNDASQDNFPAWSPLGTRIAFVSQRVSNSEIFVMDADGTNQTNLTNSPAVDTGPSWSPDGSRLAFASNEGGQFDIVVMSADGGVQTRLTTGPANEFDPAWSPDGSRIAFTSDADGNEEIYVMSADGSGQSNVTNNPANDRDPDWQPVAQEVEPTPALLPTPAATVAAVGLPGTGSGDGGGSTPWPLVAALPAVLAVGAAGFALLRRRRSAD